MNDPFNPVNIYADLVFKELDKEIKKLIAQELLAKQLSEILYIHPLDKKQTIPLDELDSI